MDRSARLGPPAPRVPRAFLARQDQKEKRGSSAGPGGREDLAPRVFLARVGLRAGLALKDPGVKRVTRAGWACQAPEDQRAPRATLDPEGKRDPEAKGGIRVPKEKRASLELPACWGRKGKWAQRGSLG